jgi:predicted extracellular nuclease
MKRTTRFASALLATATVFAATAATAGDVVISQVYGGAGCTTAACSTYDRDYIELFNKGANPVTLSGYSVQYHSKSNTGAWSTTALPASVTIPAGGYYLIAESASAAGNFVNTLPTPDVSVTGSAALSISATDGVVALVNSTTALTCLSVADCSTGSNAAVVDLVGFGVAVIYRGSAAAAAPSKTTADLRAANGCTNTDNNNADFTAGAPTPRNSASPVNSCGGGGTPTNPSASGSANPASVAQGGSTALTVLVTPGTLPTSVSYTVTVDLSSIGGGSSVAMADAGPDGNGHETFTANAGVTAATATGSKSLPVSVTDNQSRTASTSIALTVTAAPITIMAIQGHGAKSTMVGQTVTTTGIVTALNNATNPAKGFFIQDPNGDNDPTTSDGIYVYKGSAPGVVVGDAVTVTGKVAEYNGTTELTSPVTIAVSSHGNALPAAFNLSANPPTSDYNTGVCMGPGNDIHPLVDGFQASNFACLDGMLVSFHDATIVAATGGGGGGGNAPDTPQYFYASLDMPRQFRTPGIVPGDPGWANLGLSMANFDIPVYSGNPNIFEVYYGLGLDVANLPDVGLGHGVYNVGQTVGVASGIVQGFQFTDKNNNYAPTSPVFYEIYPLAAAGVTVSGTALTLPVPVAASEPGTLTIGTQNGLHFFNAQNDNIDSSAYTDACLATEAGVDISHNVGTLATPLEPGANDTCPTQQQYDTRLSKMSLQIRTVLNAPVVQVLQEVENMSVLSDIKDKIHTDDSTLTYHPFLFAGNDPQGINIGILTQDGVTVNSVSQLALSATTNACSGGGSCLLNDRPPVLLDASYNGYPFRVLAIYDRSLGSLSEKAYVGQKRRAQAEQIAKIVQALQTNGGTLSGDEACSAQVDGTGTSTNCTLAISGSSTIPLVVLGDFNANEFSDGYVDVTGTIMGTVDTDPTHSIYAPTASYVAPNPTLISAAEPALDPATHPLDWNPNYSYSFDGISEEIDHILVTRSGWKDFVRISHAKGNSDVSSASPDINDPNTPRRLSDHDGQVITFIVDRIFADGFDGVQ